ncbi:MAG TPA: ABC transporter substrate-binding protein [Chloroflexota bacterium]
MKRFALPLLMLLTGCGATAPAAGTSGAAQPSSARLASAKPAASQAPATKLRVATQNIAANAPPYIAQDRGYFKEQGLDVEFVDVGQTDQMIAPLATGQVDAITVGVITTILNAIGRGIDIQYVADGGEASPDVKNGFTSTLNFMTAPNSPIKDWKDLKGTTYGTPSPGGSTPRIVLEKGLKTAGLSLADVGEKIIPFGDMPLATSNGVVDLALGVEPFVVQGVGKGLWAKFKNAADIYPGVQLGGLWFGPHMKQLGQDTGNRFMAAYTRAVRDYVDAFGAKRTNRDHIVAITAKNTAVKDVSLYDKLEWNYINPNCSINMQTFRADLAWFSDNNFISKLDFEKVVNDSYCQAAVRQLGEYKP